jgi:hypothetical protein
MARGVIKTVVGARRCSWVWFHYLSSLSHHAKAVRFTLLDDRLRNLIRIYWRWLNVHIDRYLRRFRRWRIDHEVDREYRSQQHQVVDDALFVPAQDLEERP